MKQCCRLIEPKNTCTEKYACPWFREIMAWGTIALCPSVGKFSLYWKAAQLSCEEKYCVQTAIKLFPKTFTGGYSWNVKVSTWRNPSTMLCVVGQPFVPTTTKNSIVKKWLYSKFLQKKQKQSLDLKDKAQTKVVLGRSGPISFHRLNQQKSAEIVRMQKFRILTSLNLDNFHFFWIIELRNF